MQQHAEEFSVRAMCRVLRVSASGYYAWRKRGVSLREQANIRLDAQIVAIFTAHKQRYGSPRIHLELKEKSLLSSENRVAKRMKLLGLVAKARKKYQATTQSNHGLPVFDNLLAQDFSAAQPNQKWVADITYVWTAEGWLYLAVVMDLYSRLIIGWAMSERISATLATDALTMALWRRSFPQGVICHSDRGSQYASNAFRDLLKTHALAGSMSKKGDCFDNAAMESFFHSLKVEEIHDQRYATRAQAKQSIFEYIEMYYNQKRRHSFTEGVSPAVFEARLSM